MYVAVITVVLVLLVSVLFTGIAKRIIIALQLHRHAKGCIGNEVSIYRDQGAKMAYKGIYAYFRRDYSGALEFFEKAVENSAVSHNSSFCFDWMAQCYDALEKHTDSLDCCVKAVEAEPSNIKSLFNLADMYIRRGLFEKAEFCYNRVLRYENNDVNANLMIGVLFMGRGLYDEAEEQFLKILAFDNELPAAFAELSVLMAIKGDYSRMDSYFAKTKDKPGIETDRLKQRLDSIKKMRKLCNDY